MRPVFVAVLVAGCYHDNGCHIDLNLHQPDCCVGDDPLPFGGPQPDFGPTVTQPVAPPAIAGGTLAIVGDGTIAVVSDPDRDHIYVVDLAGKATLADLALDAHAQPGRIVEDAAHRVHVVLRSGSLATLDPATWTIAATRPVCPAPRGVAYEAAADLVHVACASGELVSLPAAGGAATRTLHLDLDLRDVAVHAGHLVVSRFRSAQLLTLDSTGVVSSRTTPPDLDADTGVHAGDTFVPDGAWRIAVDSDDMLYMLHQRADTGLVEASTHGGYGGQNPCGDAIVHTTVTAFDGEPSPAPLVLNAVVAVDFAIAHHDGRIAIVSPGNTKIPGMSTLQTISKSQLHGGGCVGDFGRAADGSEELVAVAFTPDDKLVLQSREPAKLILADTGETIALSDDSRADTGHAVFHANAGASIACASCHLEGADDGRIWNFDNSDGLRRTQSLRGGISGSEPFHWDGDQADFSTLMTEVFANRMAGPFLFPDQLAAAQHWIDQIPLVPAATGDTDAIARGKALFEDKTVACATCHNGPLLTNNGSFDVGTGRAFQVARLVGIAQHDPFLHDGRATTLADRFNPQVGGGEKHGHTAALAAAQLADLIAYLQSL